MSTAIAGCPSQFSTVGFFPPEELPMTMQVGMVGSNGIVLAGDMTCTVNPLYAGEGARYDFSRHKIKISASRRVAVTSAMDMDAADRIADCILSGVENEAVSNRQHRILEIGRSIASLQDVECIAAFLDPRPILYKFQYGRGGQHVVCDAITDRIHAGDAISPAVFWARRYHSVSLPVAVLIRLAAHEIIAAGEINSAIIGGLEIVSSDAGGFHLLSDEDTNLLSAQARHWSAQIGSMILGSDTTALS